MEREFCTFKSISIFAIVSFYKLLSFVKVQYLISEVTEDVNNSNMRNESKSSDKSFSLWTFFVKVSNIE